MYESFEQGFCHKINCTPAQLSEQGKLFIKEAYDATQQPPKKPFYKNPWVMGGAAALGAGAYGMLGHPVQDFQNLSNSIQKGYSSLLGSQKAPTVPVPPPTPTFKDMKLDKGLSEIYNTPSSDAPFKLDYGVGDDMARKNLGALNLWIPAYNPQEGQNATINRLAGYAADFYDARARHGEGNLRSDYTMGANPLFQGAQGVGGAASVGGMALALSKKAPMVTKLLGPLGEVLQLPTGYQLGRQAAEGYGIENPIGRNIMGSIGVGAVGAANAYAATRSGGASLLGKLPLLSKLPVATNILGRIGLGAGEGATSSVLPFMTDAIDRSHKQNDFSQSYTNTRGAISDSYWKAVQQQKAGDTTAIPQWVNTYKQFIPAMYNSIIEPRENAEAMQHNGSAANWLNRQFGMRQNTGYGDHYQQTQFENTINPYYNLNKAK